MPLKLDFESIGTSFKNFFAKYKIWIIGIALLLVLAVIASFFSGVGDWWFNRGVKKDKQVIANHIQNAANIQKEIANLELQKAAEVEGAKMEANRLAEDQNATNAQREITNRQIENINKAINANRGNVNADDIQKLLDQLNNQ